MDSQLFDATIEWHKLIRERTKNNNQVKIFSVKRGTSFLPGRPFCLYMWQVKTAAFLRGEETEKNERGDSMKNKTYTADEVLFIIKELVSARSGDECESQKNAVKVACKNDSMPPYSSACDMALDALSKCMDEHYSKVSNRRGERRERVKT